MHNIYSEILIAFDILMMENDMFCSELKVPFGIETYQSFRLMMIINHKAIAEWKKYTQIIVVM